ncbi:MAG: hypothetical protein IT577_13850 [Verrucomicrobiae bacterium]|nr:hypothetical protein [Verrucomicrobiae bacterium]
MVGQARAEDSRIRSGPAVGSLKRARQRFSDKEPGLIAFGGDGSQDIGGNGSART